MTECARGIDDFLSPLPHAPVPLEVLEKVKAESKRIEAIVPLNKRHRGAQTFVSDFSITFDGAAYELRFEDDEWQVVSTSKEPEDAEPGMEKEDNLQCDV